MEWLDSFNLLLQSILRMAIIILEVLRNGLS